MKILPSGIAVIEGDSHLSKWIEEQGRLDVDARAREAAARFVKHGDVVVDAGASLGDTTKAFLDAVGPSGIVYAFEPNPDVFQCLSHNCPQAICYSVALGERFSFGHLEPNPTARQNVGAVFIAPEGSIEIWPLDCYVFPRLNFLKLDIEGMEFQVLRGATETITRCRPVIMAEINCGALERNKTSAKEIVDWMESQGYRMELCDPQYGLNSGQADVYFIP